MLNKLGRFKPALIVFVLVSGLAVVLGETWLGPALPDRAWIALRTLFWASAILYFAVRLAGRFIPSDTGERPESK